jgi:hypothetical protein
MEAFLSLFTENIQITRTVPCFIPLWILLQLRLTHPHRLAFVHLLVRWNKRVPPPPCEMEQAGSTSPSHCRGMHPKQSWKSNRSAASQLHTRIPWSVEEGRNVCTMFRACKHLGGLTSVYSRRCAGFLAVKQCNDGRTNAVPDSSNVKGIFGVLMTGVGAPEESLSWTGPLVGRGRSSQLTL